MTWPWGFRPRLHRHQWSVVKVIVRDMNSSYYLYNCTVDGCGKVHAK